MPDFNWYFHRLRAMNAGEMLLRVRKRLREFTDSRQRHDWAQIRLSTNSEYPRIPARDAAPAPLLDALRRDRDAILAGKWKAFGHLPMQVDDPPRWQKDHHAGTDLETNTVGFKLNHRSLPQGADIKLVWELSRWQQVTRLAMAAHYLRDADAARKCVSWLDDWIEHNPPFRGWNWTSPLEAGLRMIQFVWIDAFLAESAENLGFREDLDRLRDRLMPAHFHYTWRHRSFGSSANNHLIGELAGLLAALARWPNLAIWGSGMDELQGFWETEVVNQFAPDGSNREQALSYQLFSWELSAVAWQAVQSRHRQVSSQVEERLGRAAAYYVSLQREPRRWDYGDGDDATVLPFWSDEQDAAWEWRNWMHNQNTGVLGFFWNAFRRNSSIPPRIEPVEMTEMMTGGDAGDWYMYPNAGMAIRRRNDWFLRFDLSPLGYGSTCAHGHLDVLHLSLWFHHEPIVIDPGTGAYYGDKSLRAWLASRAAHNGPAVAGDDFPTRLGPFLWSSPHSVPAWRHPAPEALQAEWFIPAGTTYRKVHPVPEGWCVTDDFLPHDGNTDGEFSVRWQFAPGARLIRVEERRFRVEVGEIVVQISASDDWETVIAEQPEDREADRPVGLVSPRFRQTLPAPALILTAHAGYKPCVFSTTFLASAPR